MAHKTYIKVIKVELISPKLNFQSSPHRGELRFEISGAVDASASKRKKIKSMAAQRLCFNKFSCLSNPALGEGELLQVQDAAGGVRLGL